MGKLNKSFKICLLLVILCLSTCIFGCSSDSDDNKGEACWPCNSDADCNPGFWCADFMTGSDRCVPDSVGPADPYTCRAVN